MFLLMVAACLCSGLAMVGQAKDAESVVASVKVRALDPSTIWDRRDLYRVPKSWGNQDPFMGEVTPMWIEGEPYHGKPTRLFTFLGLPAEASPSNKAPGIVLVHGGAGTAYPEWVRLWTRRGYAAITVDNCGQLPALGADGKWIANPDGGPRGWREEAVRQVNEPIREQWMYHAIAASVRAHSYLRSLACVDTSNIGVTGISWGGIQTCILAALDDRFTYAVPVYGCAFNSDPGGIMSPELHGPSGSRWGQLWDPQLFLPFAKVPFLWVDGTNDKAFSLEHVIRSADLVQSESQYCVRLRMVHAHGAPGEAPEEIRAFADHYAKGNHDIMRISAAELDGRILSVRYAANGRKLKRVELLWTEDGESVVAKDRLWQSKAIDTYSTDVREIKVEVPSKAYQMIMNLIDEEGLIVSTRMVTVPTLNKSLLERVVGEKHKIIFSDTWGGGHRIVFDFNGRRGWIIEPDEPAKGRPWIWTMQWMGAYLDRTGALQLTTKGWYHVHLEAFDTKADDSGIVELARFQKYLVNELGFATKSNLIGMSWGGFFSVRYASEYPENVARIYLDAPLLNVYTLKGIEAGGAKKRIGSWAESWPANIESDHRMAVNRAERIADAGIPVFLLYGKTDETVPVTSNSELFADRFKKAGGKLIVTARDAWGLHPHGLDPDKVSPIVDFFLRKMNLVNPASWNNIVKESRSW